MIKRLIFDTTLPYCFEMLTLEVLMHYKRASFERNKHVALTFFEFSKDLKQSLTN